MSQNEVTFTVECMDCGGCVVAIKEVLGSLDGVASVNVHLPSKQVAVAFNESPTDALQLKDAVMKHGHWCFVRSVQKAKRAKRLGISS